MQRSIAAWRSMLLCRAWQTWVVNTHLELDVLRRLLPITQRIAHRTLLVAFHGWTCFNSNQHFSNALTHRAALVLRRLITTRMLAIWRHRVSEMQHESQVVHLVAVLWKRATNARTLRLWAFIAAERRHIRSLVFYCIQKSLFRVLGSSFHAWLYFACNRKEDRQVKHVCTQDAQRRCMMAALRAWLQYSWGKVHRRQSVARSLAHLDSRHLRRTWTGWIACVAHTTAQAEAIMQATFIKRFDRPSRALLAWAKRWTEQSCEEACVLCLSHQAELHFRLCTHPTAWRDWVPLVAHMHASQCKLQLCRSLQTSYWNDQSAQPVQLQDQARAWEVWSRAAAKDKLFGTDTLWQALQTKVSAVERWRQQTALLRVGQTLLGHGASHGKHTVLTGWHALACHQQV
jgi:hypothetical protein